jgi:hypothetical protein
MICSECKRGLSQDLQGRVKPCQTCLDEKAGESFAEGLDAGYEEGYHELLKTVFKGIYKQGYADCYMTLTNDYISNWKLQFAADDAQEKYIQDEE